MDLRAVRRLMRVASLAITVYAFSLGGCGQLLQTNYEAFFAPQVLSTGFILPWTLVFRLFENTPHF